MASGGSSQSSQKPANGLYLEPDDPGHTIQLLFLTETLIYKPSQILYRRQKTSISKTMK